MHSLFVWTMHPKTQVRPQMKNLFELRMLLWKGTACACLNV